MQRKIVNRLFSSKVIQERIRNFREELEGNSALKEHYIQTIKAIREICVKNDSHVLDTNEEEVKIKIITPVLKILGFTYEFFTTELKIGGEKVDYALFTDPLPDTKEKHLSHSIAILEAKKRRLDFDKGFVQENGRITIPAIQIIKYINAMKLLRDTPFWGILSNGKRWRLYYSHSNSLLTNYFECYVEELFSSSSLFSDSNEENIFEQDNLIIFYLLFRKESFEGFLDNLLRAKLVWEKKVVEDLSKIVFSEVFTTIAKGFFEEYKRQGVQDPPLDIIYQKTLIFLYRLLFVIHAEDRKLLPRNVYSLSNVFSEIKKGYNSSKSNSFEKIFSSKSYAFYIKIMSLFNLIDEGDPSLRIPPYNGGLFKRDEFFSTYKLSDLCLAKALTKIRYEGSLFESKQEIDYAEISVKHLGSIYEGLLSFKLQYDANTDELYLESENKERKLTGTFYTPNEITKTIVDSCINNYWKERMKHMGLPESFEDMDKMQVSHLKEIARNFRIETKCFKLQNGIRREVSLSSNELKEKIKQLYSEKKIQALLNVKILDMCAGSGHFLVDAVDTLLDLIVGELDNAQEFNNYLNMLRKNIIDELSKTGIFHPSDIDDYLSNENIIRRIILKKCVYAVDINPLAIELLKVSLWLHSFMIGMPLAFIDHHVKTGNSLLGEGYTFIGSQLQMYPVSDDIKRIIREIEEKLDLSVHEVKKETRDYEMVVDELNKIKANFSLPGDKYFYWPVEFPTIAEEGGFDIVIGNPPYVRAERLEEIKKDLKMFYRNYYDAIADIYVYFFYRAYEVLKDNGFLGFITSNKWMRALYGQKLREFMTNNMKILNIIDYGGKRIFKDATVDTAILIAQKSIPEESHTVKILKDNKEFEIPQNINTWILADDSHLRIKEKIEQIGKPLKDWDVKIYRGILTGLNDAFIINSTKQEEILNNCQSEDERKRTEAIIKQILRGRDIYRYGYKWAGLWVIGTFPALHLNIDQYPAIKKYFLDHFDIRQLEQSGKKYPNLGFNARKKTSNKWFETQDQIAYYPEFEKEKIVWQEMTNEGSFAWDVKKMYVNQTCYMMTNVNKYNLALLNSKIIHFYFSQISSALGLKAFRWIKQYVEKLPIPKIPESEQQPFINLVDKILAITQDEDYLENPEKQAKVRKYENQIDQLVYKLYNLSQKEIEIVEKACPHQK